MRYAIIILNWNSARETIACVESIRKWSNLQPDIYVVDNNSTIDDRNVLNAHSHKYHLIVNRANLGYSGGNNIGIKAALENGNEAIMLLNFDARIEEKDINILMETLKLSPDIGIIGPAIYESDTKELINGGGKDIGWNYISHLRTLLEEDRVYEVDYVSGTAVLIRSEVFEKIGMLDERYFFSGEVADLCKRAHRHRGINGSRFRVSINPQARVMHTLRISSERREKLYTYYTVRNRFLYIRKYLWMYSPALYIFWIYKHLNHALACYRMGNVDNSKIILRGVIHGLIGRFGPINNPASRKSP